MTIILPIVCIVVGVLIYINTGSILFTILGIIAAGFICTLIGFLFHERSSSKAQGYSSTKDMWSDEARHRNDEIARAHLAGYSSPQEMHADEIRKLNEENENRAHQAGYSSAAEMNWDQLLQKTKTDKHEDSRGQDDSIPF